MPDWPRSLIVAPKTVLSSHGLMSGFWDYAATTNVVTSTGSVWPAANRAILTAITIEEACLIQKMGIVVTTQSGNCDVGIYDEKGNKLVTKGATAVAAAGLQTFDITDTWVEPGIYWLALACDNGTAAFQRTASAAEPCRVHGPVQEMASAYVLPTTITFANETSAYQPLVMAQINATL